MSQFKNIPSNNWFVRKFKELDNWLLIHYPIVWRSRLHYFVVFSFLLGNSILYGLGSLVPVSFERFWTVRDINNILTIARAVVVLIIIYWIYLQIRIQITRGSLDYYLLSWFLNSFCIIFLIININVLISPIIINTANLIDNSELKRIHQFHKRYNFWDCSSTLSENILADQEESIRKDLAILHIAQGEYKLYFNNTLNNDILCHDGKVCLIAQTKTGKISVKKKLKDKIDALEVAKKFSFGNWKYFNSRIIIFFTIIIGIIVTLAVSFHRLLYKEFIEILGKSVKIPDYTNLINKLDTYFLINHPYLWATRFHTHVIHIALAIPLLIGTFFLIDFEYLLSNLLVYSQALSLFVLFSLLVAISLGWIIKQIKIKAVPKGIATNIYLIISYFLIINIIPNIFVFILLCMDLANETQAWQIIFVSYIFSGAIISFVINEKFIPQKSISTQFIGLLANMLGLIALMVYVNNYFYRELSYELSTKSALLQCAVIIFSYAIFLIALVKRKIYKVYYIYPLSTVYLTILPLTIWWLGIILSKEINIDLNPYTTSKVLTPYVYVVCSMVIPLYFFPLLVLLKIKYQPKP